MAILKPTSIPQYIPKPIADDWKLTENPNHIEGLEYSESLHIYWANGIVYDGHYGYRLDNYKQ